MSEIGSGVSQKKTPLIEADVGSGLKFSNDILSVLLMATDAVVVLCALISIDFIYHSIFLGLNRISYDVISAAIISSVVFVSLQYLLHVYQIKTFIDLRANIKRTALSWIGVFFIIGWAGFLMKITEEFSRVAFSTTFLLGLLTVILVRLTMTAALKRWLQSGHVDLRRAYLVYVGDPGECARVIEEAATCGVRIVGTTMIIPADLCGDRIAPFCRKVLGDIREVFSRTELDETYLVVPWSHWSTLEALRTALSQLPLPAYLVADTNVEQVLQSRRLDVGELTAFEILRSPLSTAELYLKRVLDLVVASMGLVLLAPLLAMVSLAIYLEAGKPIIFRQERNGLGRKPFTIYKFRTMWVTENNKEHIAQASRNDPRVTGLGAVLRRTNIDEVPQLLNVLKGDMSIVGPRPHAIAHDEYYHERIASYAYRHNVKPGLTGWAQVHGLRGQTRTLKSMAQRVELDLWYLENWSIWLDLQIMLRTVLQMPFDKRAY